MAVRSSVEEIEQAIETGREVLLLLENGVADRPVIIGFIDDTLAPSPTTREQGKPPDTASEARIIEADVDGKRVRLVAQDEVVLECGSASITLRRNGRVIIKGTYVETHSDGTNRIKGGQVRIN
jgi:hypothetical protein